MVCSPCNSSNNNNNNWDKTNEADSLWIEATNSNGTSTKSTIVSTTTRSIITTTITQQWMEMLYWTAAWTDNRWIPRSKRESLEILVWIWNRVINWILRSSWKVWRRISCWNTINNSNSRISNNNNNRHRNNRYNRTRISRANTFLRSRQAWRISNLSTCYNSNKGFKWAVQWTHSIDRIKISSCNSHTSWVAITLEVVFPISLQHSLQEVQRIMQLVAISMMVKTIVLQSELQAHQIRCSNVLWRKL